MSPGPRSKRAVFALVSVALAISQVPCLAEGQDLAAERRRVLTQIGVTREVDLPLFPLAEGVGVVFRQEVLESGAESLRIHFAVLHEGEGWGVRITDPAGTSAWSTWAGAEKGAGFWSAEIAGERAIVEVHSLVPRSGLELKIDRVAVRTAKVTPVSITGVNQLASIVGQDEWIRQIGRAVARLRFVGDDGQVYVCTAFLITADLMLTNQHCIASDSERQSALVDFDFDAPDAETTTLRLDQLLATDIALDYSVVRLARCVGRVPLQLDPTRPPDGAQLLIVQHPGGEPQQVSIADCEVDGVEVAGRDGTLTDFGHQCDTIGGSSGSPVMLFESRRVVGLHHLGIRPGSPDLVNRAAHIGLVLDDLDPALRAEIAAGR